MGYNYLERRDRALGVGAVFSVVPIAQGSSGETSVKAAQGAGTYVRLHGLLLTLEAAGQCEIEDDGDNVLSTLLAGANGGVYMPYTCDLDGCVLCPENTGLQIQTDQKAFGHAIVSVSKLGPSA